MFYEWIVIFIFGFLMNLLFDIRFLAVSYMDLESGFLSFENFKTALSNSHRQPKLECIKGPRIYVPFLYYLCKCVHDSSSGCLKLDILKLH